MKNAASKVMWVGRATIFIVGLAVVLFLTLAIVARAADARVTVVALKNGVVNTVNSMTTLVGTLTDPILKLDNNGTGPALQLEAGANQPPLVVNADAGTATNLNADQLDGFDSTHLAGFGETAYEQTVVIQPCSEEELLSKTFAVPRETLVYASATTAFFHNAADLSGSIEVNLLDASSGDVLGTVGSVRGSVVNGEFISVPLSLQGVVHAGDHESGAPYSATSTPLVLTPGNQYKLHIVGRTAMACQNNINGSFHNIALSYLLIGKP